MIALIIILVILLLLVIFLNIPSVVEFELTADGHNVKTKLVFKYSFIKFAYSAKEKKAKPPKKEKKQVTFNEAKAIFNNAKKIYAKYKHELADILKYTSKHAVTVRQLDVFVKFDFENPMHTGIATGAINGVVYNAIALIDNVVGVKKHNVCIEPLFLNTGYFSAQIHSIVRIKNVHIIIVLIKLLKLYFKIKKLNKHNKQGKD